MRRYKIEEKRVFVMDERIKGEEKPFAFEVDRGDGEKIKVVYGKTNDVFC